MNQKGKYCVYGIAERANASASHIFDITRLVNSGVLRPVGADDDVPALDLALGLQLEEVGEVIHDAGVVRPRHVAHGGQEHAPPGVSPGDLRGVPGRQRVVPEAEEGADLVLCDGLGGNDPLRHDAAVVVVDLPLAVLVRVDEGVPSPDFLARGTHVELRHTTDVEPRWKN